MDKIQLVFDYFKFIKYKVESNKKMPYIGLGPSDMADTDNVYSDAIYWALNNKDVFNIAISGADGSGKSSVLKSFFKRYNSLKYINVSLANFYGENNDEKEMEQIIEKSILQQLFYSVSPKKIPFSRINRISKISKIKIWIRTIIFIFTVYLIYFIKNPSFLNRIKLYFEDNQLNTNYISLIFIMLTLFLSYILFVLSFYIIKGMRLSKVSFKNNQIEIIKDDKESIFNKYVDEIIYFFDETKYNIVVFEDLDRFKSSTKVFVKLRELNILLNSSMNTKLKKRIVFIYAVRDDLFTERMEKTKFFDFIIPVVPINTLMNIPKQIKNLFNKNEMMCNLNFSNEFLNDMAMYILDRRTLNNIINEFYIYLKKYNNNIRLISYEKQIFSLIVYKNAKPSEYSKLIFNEGIIFNFFANKYKKIDIELKKIEEYLKDKNLDKLEKEKLTNRKKSISSLSLAELIKNYGIYGFDISETDCEDEIFFLKKGYIDESYLFYLSYFAEGILSENDMNFYLSVKNGHEDNYLNLYLELDNYKYLILMFNEKDFKSENIYNYYFVRYMLFNRDKYTIQLNAFSEMFCRNYLLPENYSYQILSRAKESDESFFEILYDFIQEKTGNSKDLEEFIRLEEESKDKSLLFLKYINSSK